LAFVYYRQLVFMQSTFLGARSESYVSIRNYSYARSHDLQHFMFCENLLLVLEVCYCAQLSCSMYIVESGHVQGTL